MSVASKNYYELLGVARSASKDEIKSAYKELARLYHPDSHHFDEIVQNSLSPEQDAVFKIITAAYNTLVHDQKRADYDAILPPELRGWESDSSEFWHQPERAIQPDGHERTRSQAYAMGTFGQVDTQGRREEPEELEEPEKRSGFFGGLFSRLRAG